MHFSIAPVSNQRWLFLSSVFVQIFYYSISVSYACAKIKYEKSFSPQAKGF